MTTPARRWGDEEADALARRLAARVPRDASSMTKGSIVDLAARRPPLGLAPVDTGDDDDDASAPEMSEARAAEIVAYRVARGENRGAVIADIDVLIERALAVERHAIDKGFDRLANAAGECIGEVAGEVEARLSAKLADEAAKVEGLTKTVDALRLQLARMEGAASERARNAPRTVARKPERRQASK